MATGQAVPNMVLLAPAMLLTSGTSHATTVTAFRLHGVSNPGWDIFIRPWDLVVNTTDNTSAHVTEVINTNTIRLSRDIFTAGGKAFKIVRAAEYRNLPPAGVDIQTWAIRANSARANAIQGIEILSFDDFSRRKQFLYRTDAGGVLEKIGQQLLSNAYVGTFVANYSQFNCTVRLDSVDVTI